MSLTTMQRVRQQLTGSPFDDLAIQHEGPEVVRWIWGGTAPDLYVRFVAGVMRCATCDQALCGVADADGILRARHIHPHHTRPV